MDKKVPKYFINVMLSWFQCCVAAVRWGNALSSVFTICAGVRQGGLLSPLLFSIYMDVLINRLRSSGIGCNFLMSGNVSGGNDFGSVCVDQNVHLNQKT